MNITNEMETNLTIGQFSEAAEYFDRSKEYFDLLKEASEISLMEKYLECQQFLIENSDIPAEMKSGLITESAEIDESFYESLEAKKTSIWSRIGAGIRKVVNTIVTLFARLINFWKNGKEIERLKAEAKTLAKINADKLDAATNLIKNIMSKHTEEIARFTKSGVKKDGDLTQLKIVKANPDGAFAIINNNFKSKDIDMYRQLQVVSGMLSDEIEIAAPVMVCDIDTHGSSIQGAIDAYTAIRSNKNISESECVTQARKIENLLNVMKATHNTVKKMTINISALEKTYNNLLSLKESIEKSMDEANGSFSNSTKGSNNVQNSEDSNVKGIAAVADKTYQTMQTTFVNLFSEWVFMANACIKSMKEIMDLRNSCVKTEGTIIHELKRIS